MGSPARFTICPLIAVNWQLFENDVSPMPAVNWNCGAGGFVGAGGGGVSVGGRGVLVGGRGPGVLVGGTGFGGVVGGAGGGLVGTGELVAVLVDGTSGVEVSVAVGVKVGRLVRVTRGVEVASALVSAGSEGAPQASATSTTRQNHRPHWRIDFMNANPPCEVAC